MNSKKLSINFIASIIQFLTALIISFFFTPYIVSSVGEAGYGFYSIACTCISYFTVLTTAMNSMVSRFITIAYHNGQTEKVKSYYSTVFYSNLAISFLFSIIVIACVSNINRMLNVPAELLSDVKGMFYFVLFAGLFASVTSVFSSTVFCHDRLDIKSIAMIFISVIRVGLLYYLLAFTDVKLIGLGVAYSVSIVLETLVYIVTTVKMMPIVKLSPREFSFDSAKALVGSGIWNSVNQVNTILLGGLNLILANILVSPAIAGVLSVSTTIPHQLTSLYLTVANIFLPALTIAYSKGKKDELKGIFKTSFDVLGVFMGVVMAGFIVVGKEFFALWMPQSNSTQLYILALLGMVSFFALGNTQTIGQAALLANKMRLPVLIVLLRNIFGLAMVFVFSKLFPSLSVYFIAGVSQAFVILFELFFNVPFSAKCVDIEKRFFYKQKLKFVVNVGALILIFAFVKKIIMSSVTWKYMILCVAICAATGLIFNVFYYFNKATRKSLFVKMKSKLTGNK